MKLIILDRDGVINEDSDDFIKSPDEWIPIEGSLLAIARLTCANYHIVVATNQSGIARGLFDLGTLNLIHQKMNHEVEAAGGKIEAIFFCPHGPDDNCNCRKPKTGLYQDIANRLRVSLEQVPVIGDSLRDLQSAKAINARPILVLTGKGTKTREKGEGLENVEIYENLAEASDALLAG